MEQTQETFNRELLVQLARLGESFSALQREVAETNKEVADLRAQVLLLRDQANRWKGGLIVLFSLGGLFGWLIETLWSRFIN